MVTIGIASVMVGSAIARPVPHPFREHGVVHGPVAREDPTAVRRSVRRDEEVRDQPAG